MMREWIWRNLRLECPADWEMLLFSRSPAQGRCVFADRYAHRLELSWRVVPGRPDFDRMLSDYAGSLRAGGRPDPAPLRAGAWRGWLAEKDGRPSSRLGLHLPAEACLVELVFLWPDARDEALEHAILDSVRDEPADADGLRRWRAFGLDARVSPGLDFRACVVQPARAEWTFAAPRGRRRERFARLGLVDQWLRRPVGDWLLARAPANRKATVQRRTEAGHEVFSLVPAETACSMITLPLKGGAFGGEAWICPRDGRLYAVEWTGGRPRPGGGEPRRGRRLACCETGVER